MRAPNIFYNDFYFTSYILVEKKVIDFVAPARYIMRVILQNEKTKIARTLCLNYPRNKSSD